MLFQEHRGLRRTDLFGPNTTSANQALLRCSDSIRPRDAKRTPLLDNPNRDTAWRNPSKYSRQEGLDPTLKLWRLLLSPSKISPTMARVRGNQGRYKRPQVPRERRRTKDQFAWPFQHQEWPCENPPRSAGSSCTSLRDRRRVLEVGP